jgi:hypothetical protein
MFKLLSELFQLIAVSLVFVTKHIYLKLKSLDGIFVQLTSTVKYEQLNYAVQQSSLMIGIKKRHFPQIEEGQ